MNDLDDILDRLSNPENIKNASALRDRPMDRFGATQFRADILGKGADLQVEQRTPQGSQFAQTGVWLDLNVTEVAQGKAELGEQRLWIRAPGQRQNGQQNADDNSELGQMILAAYANDPSIKSLRSLPGRKNVTFKEQVHKYTGRQRNDQTGEWGDREFTTYYYALSFSGASTNGATPAAGPTEAAVARALELVRESGEDGITETEFRLTASRDPLIKGDRAMVKWLTSGTITAEHPEVGRVEDRLVWLG